jgi:uncharacterized phage protein (TIGR01671 family)
MREILFRGKRTDNGEWVYGYVCCHGWTGKENTYIIVPHYGDVLYSIEVDPETVGQYTGLKDKNGTKIFEGDIVLLKGYDEPYQVVFDESCFQAYSDSVRYAMDNFYAHDIEVIGNIYDNPELLGGKEDDLG